MRVWYQVIYANDLGAIQPEPTQFASFECIIRWYKRKFDAGERITIYNVTVHQNFRDEQNGREILDLLFK